MPTLKFQRDKGWADKVRKYRIIVDGAEVGRLGEGAVLTHEVAQGQHVVQAKIDWCGSRPLVVDVQQGGRAVTVRSALRGLRLAFVGFYIVFNWNGYLVIESAP